jgi:YbbR domain-containing protein
VLLKFIKTKFPLFTLSLLMSFIFWLMVSASGTSNREMVVPLEAIMPDEKVAVLGQPLPDKITIRVEANTAQFKLIENRSLVIKVDLSKEEPGSHLIKFDTEEILNELQLPRGVTVVRVQPDEIPYQLYGFITKIVPVEMSLIDSDSDKLVISGPITIEPTEVLVKGPSNIMENLNYVPVVVSRASVSPGVKLEVKPNLSAFGSKVEVDPKVVFMASPNVSWKRSNVTVTVPVTVAVAADSPSLGDGINYSLLPNPESVNVTLSWPTNHSIPDPSTSGGLKAVATVDLKELERLGGIRLEVDINLPFADLDIIRVNPSKVYVTLKRLPPSETTQPESLNNSVPPAPPAGSVDTEQATRLDSLNNVNGYSPSGEQN